MIFALAQPYALLGLATGLIVGAVLRHAVHATAYRWAAPHLPRTPTWRIGLHPLGLLAACVSGTGFGSDRRIPDDLATGRARWCILAGPVAVLVAGRGLLVVYGLVWPDERLSRLYLPSDVLHGAPAGDTGPAGQVILAAAVAMTAFAVISLLPLPPADGWRLWNPRASRVTELLDGASIGAVLLLMILIVPVGDLPIGHRLLDLLAAPLLRAPLRPGACGAESDRWRPHPRHACPVARS